MNRPTTQIDPGDDTGPLDENGQQILLPEEAAAFARLEADPAFWESIRRAEEDIAAGRVYTSEEVTEYMAEVRSRFLAERSH